MAQASAGGRDASMADVDDDLALALRMSMAEAQGSGGEGSSNEVRCATSQFVGLLGCVWLYCCRVRIGTRTLHLRLIKTSDDSPAPSANCSIAIQSARA